MILTIVGKLKDKDFLNHWDKNVHVVIPVINCSYPVILLSGCWYRGC
jgi:hypothetical protein